MTDIALTVNKESVYEEVAQTTAYTDIHTIATYQP